MAHRVDGWELRFTHRSSWRVFLHRAGKSDETVPDEIVPVTWTLRRRQVGKQDSPEMVEAAFC